MELKFTCCDFENTFIPALSNLHEGLHLGLYLPVCLKSSCFVGELAFLGQCRSAHFAGESNGELAR